MGTGNPNPDPCHSGPAVAVVSGNGCYIIDSGPGVVRQAVAAGIEAQTIDRVFLTHLHSDHTSGLPDLILTPWVMGRQKSMELFGPKGTGQMAGKILLAYDVDIRTRRFGLENASEKGWQVNSHEIETGYVYRDRNIAVKAFRVNHGNMDAFGYSVKTDDRKIVISGDTKPCRELVENARNCDILLHEVYSIKGFRNHTKPWKNYHKNMHTSAVELGKIASEINPGILVMYHQLYWGQTDKGLVKEVGDYFTGEIISGKDLQMF